MKVLSKLKLTKLSKENQRWNVMCISGYDVAYDEFKTLYFQN